MQKWVWMNISGGSEGIFWDGSMESPEMNRVPLARMQARILAGMLAGMLARILAGMQARMLAGMLAGILAGMLARILADRVDNDMLQR